MIRGLLGSSALFFRMKMAEKSDKPGKKKDLMTSIPLPKGWNSIEVGNFAIVDASVEFIDCSRDSVTRNLFPVCNIDVKHILVDSAHQGKIRLYNSDDIRITIGAYSLNSKNGMNRISFGGVGLSTADGEVWVRNFHLEPLFNNHDYSRKLGYQTDRMDVRVSEMRFKRMDLRSLLFQGKLQAGLLLIDSLLIDDYRDKRVASRPGFRPPMPQDAIRKLTTCLNIDTVQLKYGKAAYAEQTGDVPGTLFFDRISATLTALTNDSLLLAAGQVTELRGTAWLMNKGRLDLTVRFLFGDLKNRFSFSAQLGPFDLQLINPMLSNLLPARVVSGHLDKLEVPLVFANDDESKGKLLFYYKDLSIEVKDQKHTTWSKITTGVINFAANDLVVNNNNPTKSGKMKTGTIFFTRDKEKSIVNFLWKSALSGLKSTMGFNSKAQKDLIKEEKAAIREQHKEEKAKQREEKKKERESKKKNKDK